MEENYISGLVSVIIPLYNRVDYIGGTIKSVTEQTYEQVEIIVVDDGSNDGSFELVSELDVTLLTHEGRINLGQSAALNVGLKQCRGEFVAILDSDDLFETDKLTIQVDYLNRHPDVDIVYGNGTAIDADDQPLYEITSKFDQDPSDPNEILMDCYFLLPQNSLVRRSAYLKAGLFNESLRAAQDHDMLIRLAEVGKVENIQDKVFKYRKHDGSISKNGRFARWQNGFVILDAAVSRYPYKKSTVKKRRAVLHFRLAVEFLKVKRYLRAIYHFAGSALFDPKRACRVILRLDKTRFSQ